MPAKKKQQLERKYCAVNKEVQLIASVVRGAAHIEIV